MSELLLAKHVEAAVSAGSDIKRKGRGKQKNKHLIMLPFLMSVNPLDPSASGVDLGSIEGLSSPSPLLKIELQGGFLLFKGRHVSSKKNFLHLTLEKKGDISSKDVFDSIVIFDKCEYTNSSGEVLSLPDSVKSVLSASPDQEKYHFGCSSRASSVPSKGRSQSTVHILDDEDDEDEGTVSDGALEALRNRRSSGRKRKSLNYGESDVEEVDGGSDAEPSQKTLKRDLTAARKASFQPRDEIDLAQSDGEAAPTPTTTRPRRASASTKISYVNMDDSDGEEEEESE